MVNRENCSEISSVKRAVNRLYTAIKNARRVQNERSVSPSYTTNLIWCLVELSARNMLRVCVSLYAKSWYFLKSYFISFRQTDDLKQNLKGICVGASPPYVWTLFIYTICLLSRVSFVAVSLSTDLMATWCETLSWVGILKYVYAHILTDARSWVANAAVSRGLYTVGAYMLMLFTWSSPTFKNFSNRRTTKCIAHKPCISIEVEVRVVLL